MDASSLQLSPNRIGGALIASAIGDALGWPNEHNNQRVGRAKGEERIPSHGGFETWSRWIGGRFYATEEPVRAGEYSDDTQLLIATARSLLTAGERWFDPFTQSELPAWLSYERGGGRATKRAAQSWLKGTAPWEERNESSVRRYFEAGGNGAAMRILPHIIVRAGSLENIRRDVLWNGIATHGHPRALVGALVYAAALHAALLKTGHWQLGELIEYVQDLGEIWRRIPTDSELPSHWLSTSYKPSSSYVESWTQTVHEVEEAIKLVQDGLDRGAIAIDEDVLSQLGALNSERSGAGTVTAIAALFLASRYAADPATGVRTAAYTKGADTDTLASMTAGLLGAMLSDEWIPSEWHSVQDMSFLQSLASSLAALEEAELSIHLLSYSLHPWTEADAKRLRDRLQSNQRSRLELGPLGNVKPVESGVLHSRVKKVTSRRWCLRSEDGQTVYVTAHSRETSSQLQPTPTVPSREPRDGPVRLDRMFAEVSALADDIGPSLSAADLLRVLLVVMERIRDTAGPSGNPAQLPAKPDLRAWLHDAVASRRLPPLSDEALLSIARVAWRIMYGGHVRPPQNGTDS